MYKTTVVLCTYNGELYIKEQLLSILNQTILPDEIVVVDDKSKDNTIQIVTDILNDHEIENKIIVNETNLGVVKNFEKGVLNVSNDIIFFCDQDDIWVENKIELILKEYNENDEDVMVFSNALLVNDINESLNQTMWDNVGLNKKYFSNNKFKKLLLKKQVVTGATMSYKTDIAKKLIPFSSVFLHDGYLAIHALHHGDVRFIDKCLIRYRQHENNVVGAKQVSFSKKIINFFTDSSSLFEMRKFQYNLYKDYYEKCLELYNSVDVNTKKCYEFWEDMIKLNNSNFIKCYIIIIKNVFNLNYFKFYKGFRGYNRDIICSLFSKKEKK